MSRADDLQAFSQLCADGAHACLDQIVALGVKPTETPAALRWEQLRNQLSDQMDHLSAMATKVGSQAIAAALDAAEADLGQLVTVTASAEAEIQAIDRVSDILTRAAQVLDVGLAILTLASAPSLEAGQGLIAKIKALTSPLDG